LRLVAGCAQLIMCNNFWNKTEDISIIGQGVEWVELDGQILCEIQTKSAREQMKLKIGNLGHSKRR
jgi:hypothetical protein